MTCNSNKMCHHHHYRILDYKIKLTPSESPVGVRITKYVLYIHIGDIMFFLKVLILIYLIYFHIQIYCNFQNYHSDLSYSSSVSIGDISNCLSCCGGVSAPVLCCVCGVLSV